MAQTRLATATLNSLPVADRRRKMIEAYRLCGNYDSTASILGIPLRTLVRMLKADAELNSAFADIRDQKKKAG